MPPAKRVKRKCKTHGLTDFYVVNREGRNAHSRCYKCRNVNEKRRHNKRQPKRVKYKLETVKERQKRVHQFIWNYYIRHPCVICGESDPVVLEFDHINPATKLFTIAQGRCSFGIDKIEAEIAKCQVLCANCHRRKTALTQGWYKNIFKFMIVKE